MQVKKRNLENSLVPHIFNIELLRLNIPKGVYACTCIRLYYFTNQKITILWNITDQK